MLRDIVGADTYAAAHGRLSPQTRHEVDTLNAMGWLPITTFNEVIEEIARSASMDPEAMLDKAVRLAVQKTFKTVWRVLLRVTSDDALIKRTPMIYSRGRNVGALSSRMVGPGHSELLLSGYPEPTDRTIRTIGVGIQSVVELAGRREVRMSYERTSDGGRYDLRWKL